MPEGDLASIRLTLLEFVQDLNTRVSIFLREGIQTAQGKFVLSTSGPVPTGEVGHERVSFKFRAKYAWWK